LSSKGELVFKVSADDEVGIVRGFLIDAFSTCGKGS
jgi:hypothetical protein